MKKDGTIPAVVAAHDDLSRLGEALAGLIAERDQLVHAVIPNVEADYQLKIGAPEYEKFEATLIDNSKDGLMPFYQEPKGYEKTGLSDLQGAFQNLRSAALDARPFPQWERLLFHIDEAMSWECVRNLGHMREMVLLIRNIAAQARAPGEVMEWIEIVQDDLDAVFTALAEGRTG